MSISPRISKSCTGGTSCNRRSRFEAAGRERPTASAASWCVMENSSTRRCKPCASSSGLRFSRWIFSIRAMAKADSSGISRINVGTSVNPAICAARQRRSPAMISKRSSPRASPIGRTRIGCIRPCTRMEAASSSSEALSIWVRGWYFPGCRLPTASERCCSRPCASLPANNASRPRPSPFSFMLLLLVRRLAGQPRHVDRVFPAPMPCRPARPLTFDQR